MNEILFFIFSILAAVFFVVFILGPYKQSPLWLMLSAWLIALGVPRLNLSKIEQPGSLYFWLLVLVSLISFAAGFFVFKKIFLLYKPWEKFAVLKRQGLVFPRLRFFIYFLAALSGLGLFLFYIKAGNFPLLDVSPDSFRFAADEKVPGLINYTAQLARIFVPLAFCLMFYQTFSFKKHWDLVLLCLFGAASLILFASRTQIYFIDLWVMALYLFIRRPNLKQAIKFYPIFLIISVLVLGAIPLLRQAKSYGADYLADITEIDSRNFPKAAKLLLPIYVGVSFNMQALMHADNYYQTHALQHGKVSLFPFTNLLKLKNLKPEFDLGEIFKSWWNTGTYLFPFVQDFGRAAFFVVPFFLAGILTLLWLYMQKSPNFLSVNLYAYACFFIAMSIYLSFTVRAEMYIDLFLLFVIYLIVCNNRPESTNLSE
jgi:oligosaccharide repeat unit polymerase